LLKHIKNFIILNNYIIEDDSGGHIYIPKTPNGILNNIKEINNNIKNIWISMQYEDEISFKEFLNKHCYDKNKNRTNKMEEVKKIIYKDGNLKILPKYFKEFKNLENIEITNSNVENIDSLKDCKKITRIDLSNNNIKDISVLEFLEKLSILNLNKNKINNIKPISELGILKRLYLSYNEIENIPIDNKWYFLIEFQIANNKLKKILNFIKSAQIKEIDFSYNQIERLSGDFFLGVGSTLTTLDLSYNNFNDHNDNFDFLQILYYLKVLNLEGNNLTNENLGDWFLFLKNIVSLNLNKNQLENLELITINKNTQKCEFFQSLEVLTINDNNLTSLKGLELMVNLLRLEAKNNKIKTIEYLNPIKNFKYGKFLLKDNPLKYINMEKSLEEYKNDKDTFDFDYNDLIVYNNRKLTVLNKLKNRKKYKEKIISIEKIELLNKIQSNIKEENSHDLDISFF
jgi:Leucine-rich repeat (LRR) protein